MSYALSFYKVNVILKALELFSPMLMFQWELKRLRKQLNFLSFPCSFELDYLRS